MDERGGRPRFGDTRGAGRLASARGRKARGAGTAGERGGQGKARRARPGCGEAQGREDVREARARGARESPGAREEQSRTRNNFVMDAYARFRYTVKADVPEWRNGRRGGLKNRCLTTCEFDSRLGHQFSRFCKAALWVAFFILCQKADPRRNRFCHSNGGNARNRPAGAKAATAADVSCARRQSSPLAPAQLSALNTVGQHEKRRDASHA